MAGRATTARHQAGEALVLALWRNGAPSSAAIAVWAVVPRRRSHQTGGTPQSASGAPACPAYYCCLSHDLQMSDTNMSWHECHARVRHVRAMCVLQCANAIERWRASRA